MYVDVGAIGSESDEGVFALTRLRELIERGEVRIPPPHPLPGDGQGEPCEYFLLGDDAFPLRHYMMKPYPQRGLRRDERIFNYRHSRARRTVENAFGILANRFRVFHTPMCLRPDNAEAVVMGACVLHNMLCNRKIETQHLGDHEDPVTHDIIEGSWREDPPLGGPLPRAQGRTNTNYALQQRNYLKEYMSSPIGAVSWQDEKVK